MHSMVMAVSTVCAGCVGLRKALALPAELATNLRVYAHLWGTFVRDASSVRSRGVRLTVRSVHRVFTRALHRGGAHNI